MKNSAKKTSSSSNRQPLPDPKPGHLLQNNTKNSHESIEAEFVDLKRGSSNDEETDDVDISEDHSSTLPTHSSSEKTDSIDVSDISDEQISTNSSERNTDSTLDDDSDHSSHNLLDSEKSVEDESEYSDNNDDYQQSYDNAINEGVIEDYEDYYADY